MSRAKSGFMLMEVVIALALLSILILPWIGYLRQVQMHLHDKDVEAFFKGKRVFLESVANPVPRQVNNGDTTIKVSIEPISETYKKLEVQVLVKGQQVHSIVGVVR